MSMCMCILHMCMCTSYMDISLVASTPSVTYVTFNSYQFYTDTVSVDEVIGLTVPSWHGAANRLAHCASAMCQLDVTNITHYANCVCTSHLECACVVGYSLFLRTSARVSELNVYHFRFSFKQNLPELINGILAIVSLRFFPSVLHVPPAIC